MTNTIDNIPPFDWSTYRKALTETGFALLPSVLSPSDCGELAALFAETDLFRKKIVMQQHGYGRGEYNYFSYPLPSVIDVLRHELYEKLAPVANDWNEKAGLDQRYPADLDTWLETCHAAGQTRPTPLMLRYGPGDWNALHQDLYGDLHVPFQAVLFLSQPNQDYTGGEFVMLEQRPRMQSKAIVLQPEQGQILVFTTRYRPAKGTRGYYRIAMRHGVSEVRSGTRVTLGLIFHDAA